MADPTPPYYPAGWDRERMLNAAASGEIGSLTEEQRDTFREGLRADVGQQGFEQFFEEMYNREATSHENIPSAKVKEPPFVEVLRLMEESGGPHWDEWGFAVFRSGRITDDGRWDACKERFMQIVDDAVDAHRGYEGLEERASRMRFRWSDVSNGDSDDDDIQTAARLYRSSPPPAGLSHSVFLLVTPASMESILTSPLPSSAKRQHRDKIPFVVAASKDAASMSNDEPDSWRGYFKTAVETLVDSLFPVVADGSMTPFEIGGRLANDDVWCDFSRWGTRKMGSG